ncbi:MAG: M15 family metallopeptidase [Candidatus Promineifilaceae bacterium]
MSFNSTPKGIGRLRLFLSPTRSILLILIIFILVSCDRGAETAAEPAQTETSAAATEPEVVVRAVPTSTPVPTPTATVFEPPTLTPIPTVTPSQTPTPAETATMTPTWTPTAIDLCDNRIPSDDDLLVLVTHEYGLGQGYEPADLVPLSDYFPVSVTLGYPNEIREIVIEPLVAMVNAMQAAGLRPTIISGYRSYSSQAIAWAKWSDYNPDYAAGLSARPGHSEHQLGTTLDFGSPELEAVTGIEDIEFHTYFYMTSEGKWLGEHAQEYGFTMSYPPDTLDTTGFYYEPWHYRYVGVELATQLKEQETYLIQYLLDNFPPPCEEGSK